MNKRPGDYKISYRDKYSGEIKVHDYYGSVGEAERWGEVLSQENGYAKVEGFDDNQNKRHIKTIGE